MRLMGQRNQCRGCKEYFNSNKAFDKHRTGSFHDGERRCLNVQEMEAKGMLKNSSGFWITEPRLMNGQDDATDEAEEIEINEDRGGEPARPIV